MRFRIARLGHALLDRQHARLAAETRALHAALSRGRSARGVLGRLIRVTRRHFLTEDRLMRQVDYADEAGHRALHQGVMDEMLRLRTALAAGQRPHPRHADQVGEWLQHHTDEADRKLVSDLRR